MKLGVNIPNFGLGTTPETLRRWAEVADGLGYDFAMMSDHVANTPDVERAFPSPFYDPFGTLAWLAGVVPRLTLGTTVIIVPYRHLLLTARLAANLDRITGGRFILGVGVGWARLEFEALGLPFSRRGEITDEFLEAITAQWTDGLVTREGEFAAFRDVRGGPAGEPPPRPRLWVGGSSDAALRRAVRFGAAWHPMRITMPWLRDVGLPRLRRLAAPAGRPVPELAPRIKLRLLDAPVGSERLAGVGTLDQVRRDLEELAGLGAGHVLLDVFDDRPDHNLHPERDWDMLERVAARVMPELR